MGTSLVSYTDWLWRELSLLQERLRWFELALTYIDDAAPPSVEARIHIALGYDLQGRNRGRLSHDLRAIDLLRQFDGEPALLGYALMEAGKATSRHRDVAEAEQYSDEALAILRRHGRTKWLAAALQSAGSIRRDAGDLRTAQALTEEALALSKQLGDVRVLGAWEAQLALNAFAARRMNRAMALAIGGQRVEEIERTVEHAKGIESAHGPHSEAVG